ncbi:MAG: hypothetical protein AB7O24_34225, partial [Kofleriaceae bacterium]
MSAKATLRASGIRFGLIQTIRGCPLRELHVRNEPGLRELHVRNEPGLRELHVRNEPRLREVHVRNEPGLRELHGRNAPGLLEVRFVDAQRQESSAPLPPLLPVDFLGAATTQADVRNEADSRPFVGPSDPRLFASFTCGTSPDFAK